MTRKLETRIVRCKLADLKPLEKNAHFMTPVEYGRLVANLRRDGVLTSAPLIYRGVVLSGNHRVSAAIEAEIEEADCIDILTELTQEEQTAIALSHNAIHGQDDLSMLQELYETLGLDMKAYSGLTDDSFKIDEIDVDGLSLGSPKYEELVILFLPEEKAVFADAVKKLEKSKANRTALAAHYKDFGDIFDAITATKKKLDIHNTAVALRAMANLALQQLAQMPDEAEQPAGEADSGEAQAEG